MFYTPGWGAVLTLTGTLAGALLTQTLNSAISRGTRRRERNASITKAVGELIGSANAWVYAASTQESGTFRAVSARAPGELLMDTIASLGADVYAAHLAFGSAISVVRLTCPPALVDVAESIEEAVQGFETRIRENVDQAVKQALQRQQRSVVDTELTDPTAIWSSTGHQLEDVINQLVDLTRRATGYGPSTR